MSAFQPPDRAICGAPMDESWTGEGYFHVDSLQLDE